LLAIGFIFINVIIWELYFLQLFKIILLYIQYPFDSIRNTYDWYTYCDSIDMEWRNLHLSVAKRTLRKEFEIWQIIVSWNAECDIVNCQNRKCLNKWQLYC
jgi:hypothetical protein